MKLHIKNTSSGGAFVGRIAITYFREGGIPFKISSAVVQVNYF
jgi:hypothetical protein